MCGILVANNKTGLLDNVSAIKERGTIAWSLSTAELTVTNSDFQTIEDAISKVACDGVINVIHVQSPTSITHKPHPAINNDHKLWHNGMVDSAFATKLNIRDKWDTQFLLDNIVDNGLTQSIGTDSFNGSFACIYYSNSIFYAFRNRISPLFINTNGSYISSVNSKESKRIEPNTIFKINADLTLTAIDSFINDFNPFGV